MGNRHSNRPASAPAMKTTSSTSPRIWRNGSQRKGSAGQKGLAEAAAAAAATAAVTATAAASGAEIASSSSATSQLQALQIQHQQQLVDMIDACQPIQLSAYQKNLLREAWQKINKKGAGGIGTLIFRRMFAKNPEIKQVFQHVTVIEGVFGFGLTPMQAFHHHSVLFVEVLDSAIEQLDDLRPFVKKCVEFGAKHAPYRNYGFKVDHWDTFGQCMIEVAREWEGWRKHRETIRAWTLLVSFIVDRMRQGYESAIRRQCFLQQMSTKQSAASSSSFDVAASENDEERSAGVADKKRISRLSEESSPARRRLVTRADTSTSQENASASATAASSTSYESVEARALRMARAESH